MTRLLLAVAAIAFVAVGCGAAENDPNLAAAADRTEATGSGRFEVNGAYEENGTPTSIACTGSADYERRRVTVSCTYEGVREFEAIAIGGDMYLRGDAAFGPGTRDKWVKESGEVDEDTALANLSPQRLLALLRDASSETVRVGEEDVRGEPTVRYRLTVDCESADLDCEDSAAVGVWIAEDGIVRRIAIDDDGGEVSFEFFDFGVDVVIEPPPDDQLVDVPGDLGQGGVTTGDSVNCGQGEAVPISQAKAVSTLHDHGVSVTAGAESCMLTNARGDGGAAVLAREGIVYCLVHRVPPRDAPHAVTRRGADEDGADFALENLECTIITDGPGGTANVARLEEALEEMASSVRS
jgi:hypothetical protein